MTPHLIVIHPDGECVSEPLEAPPDTERLQRAIKGWLEEVPGFTTYHGIPCIAYACEEGRQQRMPMNLKATSSWMVACPNACDILYGIVAVIVGPHDFLEAV